MSRLVSIRRALVGRVLLLYYAYRRPDTPAWARLALVAAVFYVIWPVDLVADFLPLVGYSDDLVVLAAALVKVIRQIDGGVRDKAARKLDTWFGR